jgi:hypothetical protein
MQQLWPSHPAADLFPLLSESEMVELVEDIRVHGLYEPVWLWNDPETGTVLLDGRNRAHACFQAKVELAVRWYEGDDPISFILSENLKRRHLTHGQQVAIAVEAEPLFAAEAAKRKVEAGQEYGKGHPKVLADLREPSEDPRKRWSSERAAKVVGVSGRSLSQFKRVQNHAPDLILKVKSGEVSLDRAERVVRDREATQRRIIEAHNEAATSSTLTTVDIRLGDFREVLGNLQGIEAIITDPPYSNEYLPLLGDLALWADTVLAPDGVLAILFGQTHLPEAYQLLQKGRPYRWTACYLTLGPGYVSYPRQVQSNWKPVLIYGGGPRIGDVIHSEGLDADAKSNHRWGQDYTAFHTLVERLTKRGQTVVDPFLGSGTTLLAAHALGRHAIGCDIDPAAIETARKRLIDGMDGGAGVDGEEP